MLKTGDFKTLKDKLRTLKEILHGSAVHHIERDTEALFQISSPVCKGNKEFASQLCTALPPATPFGMMAAGFFFPLHSNQFISIFLSPIRHLHRERLCF